jgi:hypothetical protein
MFYFYSFYCFFVFYISVVSKRNFIVLYILFVLYRLKKRFRFAIQHFRRRERKETEKFSYLMFVSTSYSEYISNILDENMYNRIFTSVLLFGHVYGVHCF